MIPTVSIILPTYNRLRFLREAVESVMAQTYKDWELLIADDGSEGETQDYLRGLERAPRVRVLHLQHSGNPSAVRNAGLREAHGQYVAFLDSDDIWMPAKLTMQLAAHVACPSRRWSYTALERIDAVGAPMRDGQGNRWVPHEGAIFEQLLSIDAAVATPSVLVEKRLLELAGGFDEQQRYFEDYDLWLRLSLHSDVVLVNTPLVKVRNHDQHYSADRVSVYEARFRLLEKLGGSATSPRLDALLRMECAKNAACLALVAAVAGRKAYAMRMLWRSLPCAPRFGWWWGKAVSTCVRIAAPNRLQQALRNYRRERRALAAP